MVDKMGLLQKAQLLERAKELSKDKVKQALKETMVIDSKFAKRIPGTDQYLCVACKGVRLNDTVAAFKHFSQSAEHKQAVQALREKLGQALTK